MTREHIMAAMPSGVAEICRDRFDEFCPASDAVAVAEDAAENLLPQIGPEGPYGVRGSLETSEGAAYWVKWRLIQRGVLRALARELAMHDGTPRIACTPEELYDERRRRYQEMTPAEIEQHQRMLTAMKWKAPAHLGHTRSRLSQSPLVLRAINATANRVAHFENDQPCPYCNRRYRNGNALRLHVIDSHLQQYQE